MEIFKLTKDERVMYVPATGENYLIATNYRWDREYMIVAEDFILDDINQIDY
jgi:hypothetical protein